MNSNFENYKYLSKINFPTDLRKLDQNELPLLCSDIRAFMVDTITQIGGHLGAGLGVVELTVALHYIFNTPNDKLIFDVGHQAYPHKILTGRKELLHTIRQKNGLSGFPKISESEYDAFGTGHSSTSISAALGIATARDILKNFTDTSLKNRHTALDAVSPDISDKSEGIAGQARNADKNEKVVAIIGDGALTGGLAYEALNNAGFLNKNLIVILNDNNISIDENVSAFSTYFNDLYSSKKVQSWKDNIWDIVGKVGERGDRVRRLISRFEGSVKSIITPGMLFEAIGFNYFGPINGNNIHKLIKILQNIKNLNGPIFLHIITQKGKGYDLAEQDFRKLHAIGTIDKTTGLSLHSETNSLPKYQDIFGETVMELFEENEKLVAISAAMLEGTGLIAVQKKFPARVFDVGIAEGHAVTFAAGIATQGIIPIVAVYSSFLQRAFDNIIHDCALQNLHIIFAIDRAGIVGEDGATHHGVFDISYLRMIPNMIVMAPKDEQELRNMLYSAVYDYNDIHPPCPLKKGELQCNDEPNFPFLREQGGCSKEKENNQKNCIAIRYPRGTVVDVPKTNIEKILLGKSEILVEGDDICIIAYGSMVKVALEANSELKNKNISATVVNARFAKPLDTALLDDLAKKFNKIITVEEGQKKGGFGSAVLEYFNEKNYKNQIKILGINDNFVEHGSIDLLLAEQGLDISGIIKEVEKFYYI